MGAGLAQFEDYRYLVEKDIRDMVVDFAKRTQAAGRIVRAWEDQEIGRRYALGPGLL